MELHPLVAGFDGIAEEYEHGRPGYPQHVARAIADAAGGPRLLDVGAGTGKLSAPPHPQPSAQRRGAPLAAGIDSDSRRLERTPPGFDAGLRSLTRREDLELVHHTDRERMVAHAASISFVNTLGPERRSEVLAELDAALRAEGVEAIDVPYRASLWITRRLP